MQIVAHPSPNCGPRRNDARPSLVVLHYTAMTSCSAACDALCDPAREVSSHYLICSEGKVLQLVPEALRAWHAGQGSWAGCEDVNSHSIGIELDNDGQSPFAEPLMTSLEVLLKGILARWDIKPEGVIGHSDMAPGRKKDPGPLFDWSRLEAQGLAAARGADAGPQTAHFQTFRTLARQAGYTADVDDETLLAAIRLRYRPNATGPLCAADYTPFGHSTSQTRS